MSSLVKANNQLAIQSMTVLIKFILGFVLIYATLEGTAQLLGDALCLQNAHRQ